MRIFILDEESDSLINLESVIRQALPESRIEGFSNPQMLVSTAQTEPADIYYISGHNHIIQTIKDLNLIHRQCNIVLVSDSTRLKAQAMDLHVSHYITGKASVKTILESLENLRHPPKSQIHTFRASTFGNFTLFADNHPVTFHRYKSMELFAYLTEAAGNTVSRRELTLVLYDDETHSRKSQKNLENAIHTLQEDLESVNGSNLLIKTTAGLAIDKSLLESDLYNYLNGQTDLYQGRYMEDYSWGEYFKGRHQKHKPEDNPEDIMSQPPS